MNLVVVLGNLTRDVEMRYLPNGSAVADFSIAVNSKYKTADGESKEEVDFFDITAWGKTAENCMEYIAKGSKVLIQGKLKQERWEKEDKKYSRVKIVAHSVKFLSRKETSENEEMQCSNDADIPF